MRHDIVEDTPVTIEEITTAFGSTGGCSDPVRE
jgi:(p)ppGpp synthase/HD superfamily hydrolase